MINLNSLTKNIKDGFKAPTGDSNRETPTKGALRFNTETGKPEIYAKGRGWRRASVSEISAIYTHDNLVAFYDASNADTTGDTSDQYYSDVSLLLHMNGTDGSTTFTDSSNGGHTASVNGGAVISTDQSKFGSSSYEGNGSNSYLSYAASSDFDFGTGDFTVEHWFYLNSTSVSGALVDAWHGQINGGWQTYYRDASGDLRFYLYDNGQSIISAGAVSANTWYHVAVTRENGTIKLYLDGVFKDSVSFSGNLGFSNRTLSIGRQTVNNGAILNGYLDEVRITKGVARYTADFTPQTREFYPGTGVEDITSNNISTFLQNATLNTSNPKSYEFTSGNNLGIEVPTNATLPNQTEDLTFIVWAYMDTATTSTNLQTHIAALGTNDHNMIYFQKARSGLGNHITGNMAQSGTYSNIGGSRVANDTGQWLQLALTKSGNNFTYYMNANKIGTLSPSGTASSADVKLLIGSNFFATTWPSSDVAMDGKIGLVKVYDTAFTDADITSEFNYHKSTFGL